MARRTDGRRRLSRTLTVEVLPACIGSGFCRGSAPHLFGATPEKKAVALVSPVEDSDALQDAMESCPVEAIRARDSVSGAQVFP